MFVTITEGGVVHAATWSPYPNEFFRVCDTAGDYVYPLFGTPRAAIAGICTAVQTDQPTPLTCLWCIAMDTKQGIP